MRRKAVKKFSLSFNSLPGCARSQPDDGRPRARSTCRPERPALFLALQRPQPPFHFALPCSARPNGRGLDFARAAASSTSPHHNPEYRNTQRTVYYSDYENKGGSNGVMAEFGPESGHDEKDGDRGRDAQPVPAKSHNTSEFFSEKHRLSSIKYRLRALCRAPIRGRPRPISGSQSGLGSFVLWIVSSLRASQ